MNYHDMAPSDVVVAAALAKAEESPLRDRCAILRAVAEITSQRDLAKQLHAEADALEASQHRTRQLVLSFRAHAETSGRA